MKNDVKALVAAAIFLTLMFSVVSIDLRPVGQGDAPRVQTFPPWQAGADTPEDPKAVANFMFGAYALPLQVLSLVLLVALVGALFLAKPDRTEDEEARA